MTDMAGKTAVITGAGRGIGASAARAFAASGANVVLLSRTEAEIATLAGEIGQKALAVPCDVSRFHEVQRAIDATLEAFGQVDVLINNAGVIGAMGPMAGIDPDDWAATIDINLKGVFHGMRAVLPVMVEAGGGTVLTLSSGAAHYPVEGWSAYCASKAGVAMLTRSLHHEAHDLGIRAMGLSPGTVATDMQRDIKASGVGPVAQLDWSDHIPADWPAKALLWMCGPEAARYAGEEISLRDEGIRRAIGLVS